MHLGIGGNGAMAGGSWKHGLHGKWGAKFRAQGYISIGMDKSDYDETAQYADLTGVSADENDSDSPPVPSSRAEAIASLSPPGPGLGRLVGYNSRNTDGIAEALELAAGTPLAKAGREMAFATPDPTQIAGLIGGPMDVAEVPASLGAPTPVQTSRELGIDPITPELASAFSPGTGVTPTDASGSFMGRKAGVIGQGPSTPRAKSIAPEPMQVASLGTFCWRFRSSWQKPRLEMRNRNRLQCRILRTPRGLPSKSVVHSSNICAGNFSAAELC